MHPLQEDDFSLEEILQEFGHPHRGALRIPRRLRCWILRFSLPFPVTVRWIRTRRPSGPMWQTPCRSGRFPSSRRRSRPRRQRPKTLRPLQPVSRQRTPPAGQSLPVRGRLRLSTARKRPTMGLPRQKRHASLRLRQGALKGPGRPFGWPPPPGGKGRHRRRRLPRSLPSGSLPKRIHPDWLPRPTDPLHPNHPSPFPQRRLNSAMLLSGSGGGRFA